MAKKPKRPVGRRTRTLQSLVFMVLLGAGLAVYNAVTLRNDTAMATGSASPAQRQFFLDAADRPDIAVFFKNLRPEQRLAMSQNIGRYDDPKLAKLIATLLADFDENARAELTKSLVRIAPNAPKAVADEMAKKGSFQQVGVRQALEAVGPRAYPFVADMLANGDARPFAAQFLVDAGPTAASFLRPKLDDANKDVRLAAADALGKLSDRQAVPKLLSLYKSTLDDPKRIDEQLAYLSALSGIGDPAQQALFTELLRDESNPVPIRAQAAYGLGKIGSPEATRTVWPYADSQDKELAGNAVAALGRAGDAALAVAPTSGMGRLRVAQVVNSPTATRMLAEALGQSPSLDVIALAHDRPALASELVRLLREADPLRDGERADALVRALATTKPGRTQLQSFATGPYAPLVTRRLGTPSTGDTATTRGRA